MATDECMIQIYLVLRTQVFGYSFFRRGALSLFYFLSTLSQPSETGAVFHGSGHTQRIVDNVIKGL